MSKRKKHSVKHTLVTGHSGAGKSTFARALSAKTGMTHLEADEDPELRALFESSFKKRNDKYKTRDFAAGREAYIAGLSNRIRKLKDPTILEGAQFSWLPDSDMIGDKYVIEVPEKTRLAQRAAREQRLGRTYSGDRAEKMKERLRLYTEAADPHISRWKQTKGTQTINPLIEKTSSYREGGSFTHEGTEYDLDHALSLADKQPVTSTRVKDLAWVLRHGKADPERVRRADLSAPLLVSHTSDGRPTVVDGFHRLTKANNEGVTSMPTRFVDRKELRKTSAIKHTFVTGHSGAGKSTLARSFGLPIHALDDDPDIREQLNRQMAYARANRGRLPTGKRYARDMQRAEERAIERAMALKDPHVIEGSYLLNRDPEDFKAHNMYLVDTPEDVVLDRRVERQRVKDIARNRHWDDERAKGVRMRGQQLIDEYAPGVKRWRSADYVKKASKGVATKTDPAKWARAKAQARAKMGGKHSARAMQLATQIYKKSGGGYSGKKPSSGTNKLKKWGKQKWQWSGGDKPGPGGTGVYLPKRSSEQLKSTRAGRDKLRAAAAAKRAATAEGRQFSSHGLHVGKRRSDVR